MWMPGQRIMRDCFAVGTARAVGSILVQGMIAVRLTIKPIKRAKPCLMGGQRNDIGERKAGASGSPGSHMRYMREDNTGGVLLVENAAGDGDICA